MRLKRTFRLPPELANRLADYASRKRVPQALVVETALASYLSADATERLEAALARRLDRMVRQIERLERHVTISNEAIAIFVRFWVTNTSPLPETAQPAAQAKVRERYDSFLEALGSALLEVAHSPTRFRRKSAVRIVPDDASPDALLSRAIGLAGLAQSPVN